MLNGLRVQDSPEEALKLRVTVPVKPFRGDTVIVVGQVVPIAQLTVRGPDGEIVKSWTA